MDSVNNDDGWTEVSYKKKRKEKNKPTNVSYVLPKENKEDILDFPEPSHYKSKCISFGTF